MAHVKRTFATGVGAAGAARIAVLASSLAFTAISSREIFQTFGPRVFGIVTFFATMQLLLPFADLGLGAVVMNKVAQASGDKADGEIQRILARVLRAQIYVVLVGSAVAALMLATGGTEKAFSELGKSNPVEPIAATIAFFVILVNVPASIGNRILIGLNRTHVAVLISIVGPPLVLIMVIGTKALNLDGAVLFIAWPLASLISQLIITRVALGKINRRIFPLFVDMLRTKVRDVSEPIFSTSASMLVISITSPISYNSARLILGAFASTNALATYSVAAQVYSPLYSVVNTAATPLWPRFAKDKGSLRSLARYTIRFAGIGLVAACLIMLVSIPYSWFVTGAQSYLPLTLCLCFAALVLVNAVTAPSMMRMNEGSAIRFQAATSAASCAVNLPVSIYLALHLGAIGPVISTTLCLLFLQTIPLAVWQIRDSRKALPLS